MRVWNRSERVEALEEVVVDDVDAAAGDDAGAIAGVCAGTDGAANDAMEAVAFSSSSSVSSTSPPFLSLPHLCLAVAFLSVACKSSVADSVSINNFVSAACRSSAYLISSAMRFSRWPKVVRSGEGEVDDDVVGE